MEAPQPDKTPSMPINSEGRASLQVLLGTSLQNAGILIALDSIEVKSLHWWNTLAAIHSASARKSDEISLMVNRLAISNAADPIDPSNPQVGLIALVKAQLLTKILSDERYLLPDFEQWQLFSNILSATDNNLQRNAKLFETIADGPKDEWNRERFCPSLVQYCQKRLIDSAINNPKAVLLDTNFSPNTRLLAALQDSGLTKHDLRPIIGDRSEDPAILTAVLTRLYEGRPQECHTDRRDLNSITMDESRPRSVRLVAARYLISAFDHLSITRGKENSHEVFEFSGTYLDPLVGSEILESENDGLDYSLAGTSDLDGSVSSYLEWLQDSIQSNFYDQAGPLSKGIEILGIMDDPPQSLALGLFTLATNEIARDGSETAESKFNRRVQLKDKVIADEVEQATQLLNTVLDQHEGIKPFLDRDLIAHGILNYLQAIRREDLTALAICNVIIESPDLGMETRQRAYEVGRRFESEFEDSNGSAPDEVTLVKKPVHADDAFYYPTFPKTARPLGEALISAPLEVGKELIRHYRNDEEKLTELAESISQIPVFKSSQYNDAILNVVADAKVPAETELNNTVIGLLLAIARTSAANAKSVAFKSLLERSTKLVTVDSANLDLPSEVFEYLCQEVRDPKCGAMASSALAEYLKVRINAHSAKGTLIDQSPAKLVGVLYGLLRQERLLEDVAPSDVLAIIANGDMSISHYLAEGVKNEDQQLALRETYLNTLLRRSHDLETLTEVSRIIEKYRRCETNTPENQLLNVACERLVLPNWSTDGVLNPSWLEKAENADGANETKFFNLMEALERIALTAPADSSAAAKVFDALGAIRHERATRWLVHMSMSVLSHDQGRNEQRSLLLIQAMLKQQDSEEIRELLYMHLHNRLNIPSKLRSEIDAGLIVQFRTDGLNPDDESVDPSGNINKTTKIALKNDLFHPVGQGRVHERAIEVVSGIHESWSTDALVQLLAYPESSMRLKSCQLALTALAKKERTFYSDHLDCISNYVLAALKRDEHILAEQAIALLAKIPNFYNENYMTSLLTNSKSSHGVRMQALNWLLLPHNRTDDGFSFLVNYYSTLSQERVKTQNKVFNDPDVNLNSILEQLKAIESKLDLSDRTVAQTLDAIKVLLPVCLKELELLKKESLSDQQLERIDELTQFCKMLAESFLLKGERGNALYFKYEDIDSPTEILEQAREVMGLMLDLLKLSSEQEVQATVLESMAPHLRLFVPTDDLLNDQALKNALRNYAMYTTYPNSAAATALHLAWILAQNDQNEIASLIEICENLMLDRDSEIGKRAWWLLERHSRSSM